MPLKVKTVRAGGLKVQVKKTTLHHQHDELPSSASVVKSDPTFDFADKNNNLEIKTEPSDVENFNVDNSLVSEVEENITSKTVIVKEEPASSSEEEINVLLVGDLVWSKIPGHCWWPSMVSYDPCDAVYFTKLKGKKDATKFHVQFFGDKSLRGWVFKSNIIKFEGKDHFISLPTKLSPKTKIPTSSQKPSWENAVKQAEKGLLLSRTERKRKYVFSYDTTMEKDVKIKKNIKQKKQLGQTEKNSPVNPKKTADTTSNKASEEIKTTDTSSSSASGNNVLKEIPCLQVSINCTLSQEKQVLEVESNSDSGIEDIGENLLEYNTENLMEESVSNKRTRKQKVFADYHTGEEMTLAIKSTTWKPIPATNTRKSKRTSAAKKLESHPNAATAMIDSNNVEVKYQEKENKASKKRLSKENDKFTKLKPKMMTKKSNADPSSELEIPKKLKPARKRKYSEDHKEKYKETKSTLVKAGTYDTNKGQEQSENNKELKNKEKPNKKLKLNTEMFKSKKKTEVQSSDTLCDEQYDKADKLKCDLFCSLCEEVNGELVSCCGQCLKSFHSDCLGLSCKPRGDFTCDECQTGHHTCFLCKKVGEVTKCSQVSCGKFYHNECMEVLQDGKCDDKKTPGRFFCPHHSCKLCINVTKSSKSTTSSKSSTTPANNSRKLIKCIRCPTAYHQKSCFIAGCWILSSTQMICDQHFEFDKHKKTHSHVNVTWCFICSVGGSLVCCDTCPASFHPECTDELSGVPEGSWRCKDCRQHKKPKYGDVVWVKFGVYRWWPGRICLPEEIPERIQLLPHTLGEFPVMFFGSHDYSWLHSGRAFKYEEGDKGGKLKKSNSLGKYFLKALEEAKEAYAELKKEEAQLSESMDRRKSKKPPPFKNIKANRPVSCIRTILDQSEWPVCDCALEDPCTGEAECLNRMLYFECNGKTCKTGDKCQNQRMQKCQYMKSKPFKCEGRGWGLNAEQEIKRGDFVIEYVGELIDEEMCQKRVKEYHENDICDYYFLTIDKDNIIDAYPKGNLSRFMNHSCDPNCETQKWTVNGEVRVGLFATRDVTLGEELCFNYHLDCMGNEKKQCKCGSTNCSGYLGVKPKTQHSISLAEKVKNKKKKEKERRKLKIEKKKLQTIVHEDECFVCTDGGDLILCSRGKCTKAYHLKCLNLDKNPHGKWVCPWHFCDECGKMAKTMCPICPNSYCKSHEAGEMVSMKEGVIVCSDHTEVDVDEFLSKLKKKNENSVSTQPTADQLMEISSSMESCLKDIVVDEMNKKTKKTQQIKIEPGLSCTVESDLNITVDEKVKKKTSNKIKKIKIKPDISSCLSSKTKKMKVATEDTKGEVKSRGLKPKKKKNLSKGKQVKENIIKKKKITKIVVKKKKSE